MGVYEIGLAVLSVLGAGGGLAGTFATVRHFRSQASADRRIDAEGEVSLTSSLAQLNETLTRGVFDQNAAHALAVAEVHRQHAAAIAAEREHCDERLSAMGRRLDEVQRLRAHDLKNQIASIMALAQLAKVPADKAAELTKVFELASESID